MIQKQIFIALILIFLFGNVSCANEKIFSIHEIKKLAKEANELMQNGYYKKSLIKSRIALYYAITAKDDNTIAYTYNTIAANFDELGEPNKAFIYYKKALKYAVKTSNNTLKNWIYNNLGNIYCFNKKEYLKGIYYYGKSLEISKKTNDLYHLALTKLNIVWAYFDIGDFNKGWPYLKSINEYYKKNNDESTVVALNMLNGEYYAHLNDITKANYFFQKAIQFGIKGDEKSDLCYAYEEYAKFLLKNGAYKKAYNNLKLHDEIEDQLYNEEIIKSANIAAANLELDETKRQIKKVENGFKQKQQLLQEKEIKRQKFFLIAIGLLTLTGILLYFFFQNSKLKQKNKFNIIQSKLQQNIINATIDGQELERKKIASFLHDNISAKLSSAGLHLFAFSTITKIESEEMTKTRSILKEVHDEVRNLSHELLPTLLAKFGLFFAIQDLCEKNSNTFLNFEYSSTISLKKRYNEDYETKIYFIVAELFNNIIKYSKASKSKINIEEKNNELIITIDDNGKGITINEFKTNEGFGLTQIRARVSNMNGVFKINSIPRTGTFIQIKLPIQDVI